MSVEEIKANSRGLRGAMAIQLQEPTPCFDDDVKQLLKFHGIYQQHDRDIRGRNNRRYIFMARSRIPGGKLSAQQYLVHDALAETLGQGDLRLTTRQGIQFHGVIKGNLKPLLRGINSVLGTTLAACGDVVRNVMNCPAPFGDPVRAELQAVAEQISRHLTPRTRAYHEIWLQDEDGNEERQRFEDDQAPPAEEEPIYGKTYLPRKFKIALAFPGDNCTDILSNDIGLMGLVADDGVTLHGFNVYVGGSMGQTHNTPETYPALALPLGYIPRSQVLDLVEKIVMVQRDYGDRTDRKHARMKYVVYEWGIDAFRAKVEEYLGYRLAPMQPAPPWTADDHLGWHRQADGRWFLGVYVENGRIRDVGERRIRSGLRAVIQRFRPALAITAQQNLLLSGFAEEEKLEVEATLRAFGVPLVEDLTLVRRYAMACPALPTCGLALAEAERFLPAVIDQLEPIIAELGLDQEEFSIRMTGCPNGCARPYIGDIGLVGRTLGKYNIYLGGNMEGTRLSTLYQELVPAAELPQALRAVLVAYLEGRRQGERVGDWAARVGVEAIQAAAVVAA
ncbi:MAG TPA: NADPH-dependent assimilatory sulfite reductase hemoprotein subunit [Caldilineaceae bacterium]|nr:NADPH-dependent assimilatory sulfite reductase hemoprotein subunit [Caldilineaceae bacterium]